MMNKTRPAPPENFFPSLATGAGWQAADKAAGPAAVPALNAAEFSWMAGAPAVLIDRQKLTPDFKQSGEVLSDGALQQRKKALYMQMVSSGRIPPNIAFGVATNMMLNNHPTTLYALLPAAQFKGEEPVDRPRSNHPFMQVPPPRGPHFRPVCTVHQPFAPAMSLRERLAEISILDAEHIERLPAANDTDALYQLQGLMRGHSHKIAVSSDASAYVEGVEAQAKTRAAYLQAGGPQSAWDAHAAAQVMGVFLSNQKNYHPIFPVLDPQISQRHEVVEMGMTELRMRALAQAQGRPFPWSSREFSDIYQKSQNDPDGGLNIIVTNARRSGLFAALWQHEEHFSNFMMTGNTANTQIPTGMCKMKYALPLVRAASEIMAKGDIDPNSQTGRIAAVVHAAGTALAPKAMGPL